MGDSADDLLDGLDVGAATGLEPFADDGSSLVRGRSERLGWLIRPRRSGRPLSPERTVSSPSLLQDYYRATDVVTNDRHPLQWCETATPMNARSSTIYATETA